VVVRQGDAGGGEDAAKMGSDRHNHHTTLEAHDYAEERECERGRDI